MSWNSPWTPSAAAPITADAIRAVLESLANNKILGTDLDTTGDVFTIDADLDLLGHDLLNAANVPTGIVNAKSLGVLGNGTTDDTDAIRNAIAHISNDGHGVLFFPSGTYLINDSVTLRINQSIWGAGGSTIFKLGGDSTSVDPGFILRTVGTIKDISFVGGASGTGATTRPGIRVETGDRCKIDNITASLCGCIVDAQAGVTGLSITDSLAKTCTDGIRATGVRGLKVSGLTVLDPLTSGATLIGCHDISVSGSGVYGSLGNGFSFSGCSGEVTVSSNKAALGGILLDGCNGLSLIGCHSIDSTFSGNDDAPGIHLSSCSNCIVTASMSRLNTTTNQKMTCALRVSGGGYNSINGNVLGPVYLAGTPPTLSYLSSLCYVNTGSDTTIEYGNFQVVL